MINLTGIINNTISIDTSPGKNIDHKNYIKPNINNNNNKNEKNNKFNRRNTTEHR